LRVEQLESRQLLSAGGLTVRYVPPVVVSQNSAVVQPLMDTFYEADGTHELLHYSVVADTNSSLSDAPPAVLSPGLLLFGAAANASGTVEVTVRATDRQGQTADCTVTVEVQAAVDGASLPTRSTLGTDMQQDSSAAVPIITSITQPWVYYPDGVGTDAAGNVFAVNGCGDKVWKIPPGGGDATVVAGSGEWGYDDGGPEPATDAALALGLSNVVVDSVGNVYFADTGNNVIRKVAAGNITTIAGDGSAGNYGEGTGTDPNAEPNSPMGVALDGSGNVYFADTGNNLVRKIDNQGNVTVFAGNEYCAYFGDNGPATAAGLNCPTSVAVDTAGNVYIADSGNNVIRKVDTAGING